jgi:uncharacterized protein (TIGR02466 family)
MKLIELQEHRLFPTLVFSTHIENFKDINISILKKLSKAERIEKVYGEQTFNVKDWEEIQPFKDQVDSCLAQIQSHLGYIIDHSLESMWIQTYNKPHMLEKHTHPNSWYSGVYYLSADDEAGPIVFHDPRPDVGIVSYYKDREDDRITNKIEFKSEPGLLILFPSWCMHSVLVGSGARVSISFNYQKSMVNENELTVI